MPVELDWEIEDADIPLPDTDPATQTRLGGCRRWWRLFLLIALAFIVGLGFLVLKIRQNQKELENELRALVDLELSALINGDRDLFLGRQDPDDWRWRRAQEEFFDRQYRQGMLAPWEDKPLLREYTGEIPLVRVQEDTGWAWVQVARGERTWRELWFYRWSQSDDWRHAQFDEEWLGEQQSLLTQHFSFTYHERDAAIVSSLAHEMEDWYDSVVPLFGIRPTSRTLLTIQFVYREPARASGLESHWEEAGFILQAPSFHQSTLSDDDRPTDELRHQLANYLVEALIAHQSGLNPNEGAGATTDALRRELRDWAVAQLRDELPDSNAWDIFPTPLLDALVAREGIQIVPGLSTSLPQLQRLDQIPAAVGVDALDPVTSIAFYLAGVGRAFYNLDDPGYRALLDPQADTDWRDYHLSQLRNRHEVVQAGHWWPVPSSIEIKSLVFNGEIAWVVADTTQNEESIYRQASFFRQVDDGWLLTSPDPAFFGEHREARTENLVFRYFDRGAPWFEGVLPTLLQEVFSQAANDLGMSTDHLTLTIQTELQPGLNGWLSDDSSLLRFTSPIIAGWRLDRPEDQVVEMAIPLIAGLFQGRLDSVSGENYKFFLANIAAFWWELDRLFPEQVDLEGWLDLDIRQMPETSLANLWRGPDPSASEGDFGQFWVSYRVFFDFLSETYGPEVVPALLENVQRTEELDEWLRLSTGDSAEQIEPAWQAWLLSRTRD